MQIHLALVPSLGQQLWAPEEIGREHPQAVATREGESEEVNAKQELRERQLEAHWQIVEAHSSLKHTDLNVGRAPDLLDTVLQDSVPTESWIRTDTRKTQIQILKYRIVTSYGNGRQSRSSGRLQRTRCACSRCEGAP